MQTTTEPVDGHAHGKAARMSWTRLLKRVLDIDIERCPNCAGRLKIIAVIEDPALITQILSNLGLPARAPPRAPRGLAQLIEAPCVSRQQRLWEQSRDSRSARCGAKRLNGPDGGCPGPLNDPKSHRVRGISSERLTIDGVQTRRYSDVDRKGALENTIRQHAARV